MFTPFRSRFRHSRDRLVSFGTRTYLYRTQRTANAGCAARVVGGSPRWIERITLALICFSASPARADNSRRATPEKCSTDPLPDSGLHYGLRRGALGAPAQLTVSVYERDELVVRAYSAVTAQLPRTEDFSALISKGRTIPNSLAASSRLCVASVAGAFRPPTREDS
jgi:hypothetical protein